MIDSQSVSERNQAIRTLLEDVCCVAKAFGSADLPSGIEELRAQLQRLCQGGASVFVDPVCPVMITERAVKSAKERLGDQFVIAVGESVARSEAAHRVRRSTESGGVLEDFEGGDADWPRMLRVMPRAAADILMGQWIASGRVALEDDSPEQKLE